ncbi:tetratricopeptide repeat protein [Rhodocytophaga aerolata]|uniref:Tetratricopeptide repeat protein n=1 Tax=Rhodocytophaga aerolata TaxID=455078 RepID=A0ABT8R650_9BACT|nr:tetratricopeptide repeat protein [Rhodocytophaga aerolata]MDO1447572.1 tetratricopeptide repeat protein [Rhodocytophaga aerolata]
MKYKLLLIFLLSTVHMHGQEKPKMLLMDVNMQIEATQAVNDMYNFRFAEAEVKFNWIKRQHPDHPLPYFLLGLSQWWKIVPNIDVQTYDNALLAYMDTSISLSEKMYDRDENNIEAAFFLAAAHGFKARLFSERREWRKAAFAGKNSLKYLDKSKGFEELSPEFLFGDALYNYYREWIPDNYPALKSILWLFPKGNKELGLQQLREVSNNAFYTRTEAQYFLMRIYTDENQPAKAYQLAKYLYETFPDNAYFHRYFARMAYAQGRIDEAEEASASILDKLSRNMPGYEATSGRYASYFLAYIHFYNNDMEQAKSFYKKAVVYSEQTNAYESGYYLASLTALGRIYNKERNYTEAEKYYNVILDRAEKKSDAYKEAKDYMSNKNRKQRRKAEAGV